MPIPIPSRGAVVHVASGGSAAPPPSVPARPHPVPVPSIVPVAPTQRPRSRGEIADSRAALDANAAELAMAQERFDKTQRAIADTSVRIDRAAEVVRSRGVREARVIAALTNAEIGAPGERVDAVRAEIASATAKEQAILEDGEVARRVHSAHSSTLEGISAQIADLQATRGQLVWVVLRDQLGASATKLIAAREAYLAVVKETFTLANAADIVGQSAKIYEFSGRRRLGDTAVPMPNHPSFPSANPIDNAFLQSVDEAANELVGSLF